MPDSSALSRSTRLPEPEFRQRLSSSDSGMLSIDAQGHILEANDFLCRHLHYQPGELQGMALSALGGFDTLEINRGAVSRLMQVGHLRHNDLPLRGKNGICRHFEFRCVGHRDDAAKLVECRVCERERASLDAAPLASSSLSRNSVAANRQGILAAAAFEAAADEEILHAQRRGRPLSMLSIGIDRVTVLDQAQDFPLSLRSFAEACATNLRQNHILGRVDDALFVALLPDVFARGARAAAERLRVAIAAMDAESTRGQHRRITVSIGTVTTRTARTTYRALRSRADAKRDDARNSGGNRVFG